VPSAGDSAIAGRQEVASQRERIPNAQAEFQMQLSGESETLERRVRDPSRDPTPFRADFRDGEVGEQVVEPLEWRADGK
jgi:hypothetical protein